MRVRAHPGLRRQVRRRNNNRASRRAVGTAVFGGMIAASVIGIFFIPMLYVVFQRLRERVGRTSTVEAAAGKT